MRDRSKRGFAAVLLALVCGGVSLGQDRKQASPLEVALKLSTQLERDSSDYEESYTTLVRSYWNRGMHEKALESAEKLDSGKTLGLLCYFSGEAIKLGKQEIAKQALIASSKVLLSQPENERDSQLVVSLISAALRLGESDIATNLLVFLDDETPSKAEALLSMAEARRKQGDLAGALALLNDSLKQLEPIEGDNCFYFLINLERALRLLAASDQKDRALQLVHRAHLLSQEKDPNRSRYQETIAGAYAEIGQFAQSLSLLDSYDSETKTVSLVTLASKYASAGRKAEALSALNRVREVAESRGELNWSNGSVLSNVVSIYLTLGEGDAAIGVIQQIDDPYFVQITSGQLADWFLKNGRRDRAVSALDFACASLQQLVSEKSDDIPRESSGSTAKHKSMALTELGAKLIELGEFERAVTVANSIDQPQFRAILLADVALAQVKAGRTTEASTILDDAFRVSTTSPEYRHDRRGEDALLKIAEGFAAAGLKGEAVRTLSDFLAVVKDADWKPLPDLMRLGVLCETYNLQLNPDGQAKMKRIVRQWKEDN